MRGDVQRFVEEYAQDILLYTKWPRLRHLVYFIYNAGDLRDPEALKRLEGEQSVNGVAFNLTLYLLEW